MLKRPLNVVVTRILLFGNVDGKFSNLNNPKLCMPVKKHIQLYETLCSCGKTTTNLIHDNNLDCIIKC